MQQKLAEQLKVDPGPVCSAGLRHVIGRSAVNGGKFKTVNAKSAKFLNDFALGCRKAFQCRQLVRVVAAAAKHAEIETEILFLHDNAPLHTDK
jgi:hypothetical protein